MRIPTPATGPHDQESNSQETRGFCGAQVEHVANEAGLLAVREAVASDQAPEAVRVSLSHFLAAIEAARHSPR